MEIQDIFKQIEEDYSDVKELDDDSLHYDRMDWISFYFPEENSNDIIGDIHTLQILIEQIIRFGNIVKRNRLSPELKTTGE